MMSAMLLRLRPRRRGGKRSTKIFVDITKGFVYIVVMKPTTAELEILGTLWRLGKATVRQVYAAQGKNKTTGYTTTLKLMQIMAQKGLVVRDESERTHVYRAAIKKEATQRQMAADLVDRVFGGSSAELVLRVLSHKRASREEIAEIRRMLDECEGGRK
jgi:BlaI family penicillinase repressor